MFIRLFATFLIAFCFTAGWTQSLPSYYERTNFLNSGAASYRNGLLGFANPATPAMLQSFNMRFYWATQRTDDSGIGDWGFYSAVRGFGFSAQRQEFGNQKVKDYRLTTAGGTGNQSFGMALQWSSGADQALNHQRMLSAGWIIRPARFFSIGIVGNKSLQTAAYEGIVEAGLRPLGNSRITLFADLAVQRKERLDQAPWSAGAAVEILPGLDITGRYFDSEAFTVGVQLSMGDGIFGYMDSRDKNKDRINRTNSIGFGEYQPSAIADFLLGGRGYMSLEMKGRVDHLDYLLLDGGTIRLLDLLQSIEAAGSDKRINTIALNLSGMRILPEHAWELREALAGIQKLGKKVIVFIDNATMTSYHVASVADIIMLDPQGSIMLPGYITGRTYLRGTLEKLGLTFQPFQYFKYKSAVESYYLDSLSAGDRQQRQSLIDDRYQLVRDEICASRSISPEDFDAMIDQQVYFFPEAAIEEQLADTLARWDELGDIIKTMNGKSGFPILRNMVDRRHQSHQEWGEPPTIAVVYALGECAMDSGIRARQLRNIIHQLTANSQIKAIVLRVDSPGGDGMASDYVAEALRKASQKKPVVVSQGQVAASGGYWISMYGDKIVAAPNTITGSIGVIAGWIYNSGLTEKLGMTADYVKRGEHAEIGFGATIPILGLRIPARNLSEFEQERVKSVVLNMYDTFVGKVAEGREMPIDSIRALAEGRVYSGSAGLKNGLVDNIGGMQYAIAIAKEMAGLAADEKVRLSEFPRHKGLFNDQTVRPISITETLLDSETLRFLKIMTEKPGYPHPMLLPGDYPVLRPRD